MAKKEDTYSYRGWLVSDFLLKRALAVWGHYIIAGLVFAGIISVLTFIFGLLFGGGNFFK